MYETPSETTYHEDIIANINTAFKIQKLKAVSQGLRVRNSETKSYRYPDVVVRPPVGTKAGFIDNPLLIAEVLSPSTRSNDLSDKFIAYRQFATLEYYLVVEPDFFYINLFSKEENGEWQSEIFNQLTDLVQLPKLSATLALADVYEGLGWVEA